MTAGSFGHRPFVGTSVCDILEQHRTMTPRPLSTLTRNLPPMLLALVDEMTAKPPQERPLITAVRDQIDRILIERNRKR
jgi:hypothetical protein